MSDADLERERYKRLVHHNEPPPAGVMGSSAFIGKVVTPPTAVGQFSTVNPVVLTGNEVAGGAGTFTVDTSHTVAVWFAGRVLPSVGDNLICRFADYRWVAEKMGVGGGGGGSGACTGYFVPTAPSYYYFGIPNGGSGLTGGASLLFTQGTPPWGSGVTLPVYPIGGGFPNHHVTFSNTGWYTPFCSTFTASSALGSYAAVSGGYLCLYFQGCNGYLITIFQPSGGGSLFVYNYDLTWSFPLVHAAQTVSGLTYGANTNSPFQIGQATTTQSGSGPALTGQFAGTGGILSGGTGTTVFPTSSIGAPTYSP